VAARRAGGCQGCGEIGVAAPGRSAIERLDLLSGAGQLAGGGCLHRAVRGREAADHGDDFQPCSGAEPGACQQAEEVVEVAQPVGAWRHRAVEQPGQPRMPPRDVAGLPGQIGDGSVRVGDGLPHKAMHFLR
jgi:hypothetical protein